jgi:hypothetical protein
VLIHPIRFVALRRETEARGRRHLSYVLATCTEVIRARFGSARGALCFDLPLLPQ